MSCSLRLEKLANPFSPKPSAANSSLKIQTTNPLRSCSNEFVSSEMARIALRPDHRDRAVTPNLCDKRRLVRSRDGIEPAATLSGKYGRQLRFAGRRERR